MNLSWGYSKIRDAVIAGIHVNPDGAWMKQVARNLTDPIDGFLRQATHLIHDADPLFAADVKAIFAQSSVAVATPRFLHPVVGGRSSGSGFIPYSGLAMLCDRFLQCFWNPRLRLGCARWQLAPAIEDRAFRLVARVVQPDLPG